MNAQRIDDVMKALSEHILTAAIDMEVHRVSPAFWLPAMSVLLEMTLDANLQDGAMTDANTEAANKLAREWITKHAAKTSLRFLVDEEGGGDEG